MPYVDADGCAFAVFVMADGGLLAERAEAQHLLGKQWGIMNETGSYPGQTWLWLYTLWYQVEPFKASHNADALATFCGGKPGGVFHGMFVKSKNP